MFPTVLCQCVICVLICVVSFVFSSVPFHLCSQSFVLCHLCSQRVHILFVSQVSVLTPATVGTIQITHTQHYYIVMRQIIRHSPQLQLREKYQRYIIRWCTNLLYNIIHGVCVWRTAWAPGETRGVRVWGKTFGPHLYVVDVVCLLVCV